jgi:hypothetical protein
LISGFRIQDSGFRIQDSGFRIQDSGFRIQDSGGILGVKTNIQDLTAFILRFSSALDDRKPVAAELKRRGSRLDFWLS